MLTPLLANEPFASPQAAAPYAATPGASSVLEMLLALSLVLAAIFVLAWLMRRLRALPKGRASLLRQLAELPVGEKERVVLVAAGQQYWLLGVAPGRVTLLQSLDANSIPAEPQGAASVDAVDSQATSFAAALRRSMGLNR